MSFMLNRSRHTLSSWIAIWAVLLNALMPAVSVVLSEARSPAAAGDIWTEICSTRGSIWVRFGEEPADTPSSTEHCPYCLTHAASFGLPPVPLWVIPIWRLTLSPLPSVLLPQIRIAWLMPVARAPPLPI